ncbi:MAG: 3,4-dihydroxy-2-butanone-4-phosphate synthase [Rhodospirillales bacterium]|nr:3,4-dihydroxy-2-butanone-4-phosphate synthase [Alphaproteobacteria bacterium]USO03461.1 MAG: 3,4-dihydroxy-2-butanone-4-phosphate synthase [Rhodospirillales bacterium]
MTKAVLKRTIKDARLSEEDQGFLSSIEDIVEDVRNGRPVIIVDDEDRENEGDLIIAAQMATPENINFLAKHGRGLICLPMENAMVERLGLPMMGRGDNTHHRTAFTVSIEAREGVTTGISASDRAKTIQAAIHPQSGPSDIATPGHVFPLLAKEGGVLIRSGHTEAAVDLARMAGFSGAGVICEIMNDDGTMARLPDLVSFAQLHGLKIGTIADLIAHRRCKEKLIKKITEEDFTSTYGGKFRLHLYANTVQYAEHIALVKGETDPEKPTLVRMHAMNVLSDVLGGGDPVLEKSMKMIEEEGAGVLVLLREPDPHALSRRLQKKEDKAANPYLRNYGIGAQILLDLGIRKMVLLTNSPKAVVGLEGYDLHIADYRNIL